MRKLLYIIVGIFVLLVLIIVAGPRLIDWKRFEPEIAQLVRDATGRELRIGGDIELRLVPAIELSARDLRLANPPGFESADMVSVEAVELRVALWPLLTRRVVVERFVITRPDVALAVDEVGRPNWLFEPTNPSEDKGEGDGGLPISDLRLEDVRIVDGAVSYRNALSGQDVIGQGLEITASLPALDQTLEVEGHLTLNDEPVDLNASVAPLEAALEEGSGRVAFSLETTHVVALLDAAVQAEPLFGLDGDASIDIASVGELAAWLDVPYEADPGPLSLIAKFDSDGPRVALEELILEGERLSAHAIASLDVGGEKTQLIVNVESNALDIDRYLPPDADLPATAKEEDEETGQEGPLGLLPEQPLDLSALRRFAAEVKVSMDGIRLAGYAVGPIRFAMTADDGLVVAEIDELGLYDGRIEGGLRLDASADKLTARANLQITNVDVGEIASVAAGDPPPVVGILSGRLVGQTEGISLRELAQNITGDVNASLRSAGGPEIAGQLSAFSVALDRPSLDASPSLRGSAVYGGERIEFDVVADRPISNWLVNAPFDLDVEIVSNVIEAAYIGRVVPAPVTSLDGELNVVIPSVAYLARWLGRPLPEDRPDPGGLKLLARLRSDGTSGTIEQARLTGQDLSLQARGSFERAAGITRFDLAIDGGAVDLDRYLPTGGAGEEKEAATDTEKPTDGLAALSEDPIDLAPLHDHVGQVRISLKSLKVKSFEIAPVDLQATLDGAVLEARLARASFAEGTIEADLEADAAGQTLQVATKAALDGLRADRFHAVLSEAGVTLAGTLSGNIELSTSGISPRQLVAGAIGTVRLDLPDAEFREGPIAAASDASVGVDLPGGGAGPVIEAAASLHPRADAGRIRNPAPVPLKLNAALGPLAVLLAGEEVPLDLSGNIGQTKLQASGRIADLHTSPRPDLQLELGSGRLSDLNVIAGAELPDVAPFSVSAKMSREGDVYQIADLAVRLGRSDLDGDIAVNLGDERPKVTADVSGQLLDLRELMPPEPSETADKAPESPKSDKAERLFSNEPLPLDLLRATDAEVSVAIAKLRTQVGAEVNDLKAKLVLSDGKLTLAPVTGGTADGKFEVALTLDGQKQPADFVLDLEAKQLRMGTFGDLLEPVGESVGRVDADIALTGNGNSPHAIAASLEGRANVIGEGGAVNSTALKLFAIGLTDVLNPFFGDQGNTFLNCFVISVDFEDGLGTVREMLIDFPSMSLVGTGTVNLGDEKIDLKVAPESKNISLVDLAVPFSISGPLASPSVLPDTEGTILKAMRGAGLAALYLNPITGPVAGGAAVLGTLAADKLAKGENPCVVAIRQAGTAGTAGGEAPSADAPKEKGFFDRLLGGSD